MYFKIKEQLYKDGHVAYIIVRSDSLVEIETCSSLEHARRRIQEFSAEINRVYCVSERWVE